LLLLLVLFSCGAQDLQGDGLGVTSSYSGFAVLNVSLIVLEGLKRGPDTYLHNLITFSEPWPQLASLLTRRARLLGNARSWNDISLPAPSAGAQVCKDNAVVGFLLF
jgi:hypothetical protein